MSGVIRSWTFDGRLELSEFTMKYDGDLGWGRHGLSSHKDLPL
jgi:hypothetical protein